MIFNVFKKKPTRRVLKTHKGYVGQIYRDGKWYSVDEGLYEWSIETKWAVCKTEEEARNRITRTVVWEE